MSTSPVQGTAAFTIPNTVLDYKEGWTVAYSTIMIDNALYCKDSIEIHNTIADQLAYGANPLPTALGTAKTERLSGNRVHYIASPNAGGQVDTDVDTGMDWRDRFITIVGIFKAVALTYVPGASADNLIFGNDTGTSGTLVAFYGCMYSEKGGGAIEIDIGTTNHAYRVDAATGKLFFRAGATAGDHCVNVTIFYGPKYGQETAT